MDTRSEIREFLTSRRAKLTAADVGLPDYGTRRVPGLRREEVAVLAGISVPYYIRLERGDLTGASDNVLDALARAFQLDDAERAHLFDLARATHPLAQPPRRRPTKQHIRPSVQQLLDAMTGAAAHIGNHRLDILGANALGRALYLEMFDGQQRPNAARYVFLDPRAREFYLDWERTTRDVVASLRSAAGRNPYDRDLTDLVGELSTRSEPFRQLWACHEVRFPPPHQRREAFPPRPGRRPDAQLRTPRRRLRHRPDDLHLHRRARHPDRRSARPARQPRRNQQRRNHDAENTPTPH
jgi:transcriptional regulator with XRE-family HTH domain